MVLFKRRKALVFNYEYNKEKFLNFCNDYSILDRGYEIISTIEWGDGYLDVFYTAAKLDKEFGMEVKLKFNFLLNNCIDSHIKAYPKIAKKRNKSIKEYNSYRGSV